ncbi:MAG: phosphate acyltransferase PlsX, partial [Chlamydiia bacterium]|nr:phosphate acyltransferase PlsX [Chlamydiia bacterium]
MGITEDEASFRKSKSKLPHLGVDLLGGDHLSSETLLETLLSIEKEIDVPFDLTVFSTPDLISSLESFDSIHRGTLHLVKTEEVITMDDDPLSAIRKKKGSSMISGIELLKHEQIDAFISTGNTGALVASAKLTLPMLQGINRSALITLLPTAQEPVAVIDVGANIECTPEHLVQFAQMGVAYQKSRGISSPVVGLLNIGTEEKKGRSELRETYQLLQQLYKGTDTFIGNIEGKEIFQGGVHVLVTDGFTGNVFLKTAEGISSFILDTMHKNGPLLPFSKPLLDRLEAELSSAEYPGALLCGVDGIVVKCHGDASPGAISAAAAAALHLHQNHFLTKIKSELHSTYTPHISK